MFAHFRATVVFEIDQSLSFTVTLLTCTCTDFFLKKILLAMNTICLFHNASLFFSPQRSQDGPVVKWLRDLRGGTKHKAAAPCHGQSRLRAGPRSPVGGVHVGGARASHCVFSLRAARRLRVGAQHAQVAAQSGEGGSSHRSRVMQVQHCLRGGKCAFAIIVLARYSSG